MRVDKVILRAFLSTLAAIVVLFAFMFAALSLIYPSTMMKLTYDLGMDSSSIRYATRAYDRTNDVYYIAYATEVAIGLGDEEKIVTCGESFIADEEFADYCQAKNEQYVGNTEIEGSYEQYIYGVVCVSEYALGNRTDAVEKAFGLIGDGYPVSNAAAAVLATAIAAGDTATIQTIGERLQKIDRESLSSEEKAYLEKTIGWINGRMEGTSD